MVAYICDPTTGKAEIGRSQELTNQLVSRSPGDGPKQQMSSVHGDFLAILRFRALEHWKLSSASTFLLMLLTP